MIEVWCGTPNEMARAASKNSVPLATKWAIGYLDELKVQANKFDWAAADHITSVSEDLRKVYSIPPGEVRSWSFDYISIRLRVELRNVV